MRRGRRRKGHLRRPGAGDETRHSEGGREKIKEGLLKGGGLEHKAGAFTREKITEGKRASKGGGAEFGKEKKTGPAG